MQQQYYDHLFKIVLIGNLKVGKSSLLLQFADDFFDENYPPSGVDFKIKIFGLNGQKVKLQIWDTAGQERLKKITNSYYKGAHGIILVYDVTDKQSFKDVEYWLAEVKKHANENALRVLVGNKIDQSGKREVTFEEGLEFAHSQNVKFIETSAKCSTNVEQAFISLSSWLLNAVKGHG